MLAPKLDLINHPLKVAARAAGARCDLCPCAATSIPVAPAPVPSPKLVIVGEGPGGTEERTGIPFTGRSGALLNDLLASHARVSRASAHITNAALCRADTDEGNAQAGSACAPRLLSELGRVPREVPIVTLGSGATSAVLGIVGIKMWRGFVFRTSPTPEKDIRAAEKKVVKDPSRALEATTLHGRARLAGRIVLPTLHPAYVLRSELEKPIIEIDFKRIGRVVRGQWTDAATAGTSEVVGPIPGRVRRALRRLPATVALDVETTETSSPLTARLICVGVGDRSRVVVIWPWHERVAGTLSEFLRSRAAVVGHNLFQFDRVVLERHGVK